MSQLLRRVRKAKRISKEAIVRQLAAVDPQFSGTQFWRIEAGKGEWTIDRFVLVAEALGLDPAAVLSEALKARGDPDDGAEGRVSGEEARAPSCDDDDARAVGRVGRPRRR